jgi:hypothetical protein
MCKLININLLKGHLKSLKFRVKYRLNRIKRKKQLVVVGDSHCRYYRYLQSNIPLSNIEIQVLSIRGATASGMANPDSETRAMNFFQDSLNNISPQDPILFSLGEVDCGFSIWIKAKNDPIKARDFADASIEKLVDFISQYISKGIPVFVGTVPLPTVVDWGDWDGPIDSFRRKVTASFEDRTELTKYYNAKLRELSKEKGFTFFDFEQELLCENSKFIDQKFVNQDIVEIHLNNHVIAPILREKISLMTLLI